MRPTTLITVLSFTILMTLSQASAAVTVPSWSLTVSTQGGGPPDSDTLSTVSLPFSQSHTATSGATTAQTAYDFSVSGDDALFDFDVDHDRAEPPGTQTLSTGDLFFDTTDDVLYTLSGDFAMLGEGEILLEVILHDLTLAGDVFNNKQESLDTEDEAFVLGGTGGDTTNVLSGSLAGTLLGGHSFQLSYTYRLRNPAQADDPGPPATAIGNLTLELEPEPIPEPATLGLAALGGLAALRRRRR